MHRVISYKGNCSWIRHVDPVLICLHCSTEPSWLDLDQTCLAMIKHCRFLKNCYAAPTVNCKNAVHTKRPTAHDMVAHSLPCLPFNIQPLTSYILNALFYGQVRHSPDSAMWRVVQVQLIQFPLLISLCDTLSICS
jgi:hypothetical protein